MLVQSTRLVFKAYNNTVSFSLKLAFFQRLLSRPLWKLSMASNAVTQRLEQRAQMADDLIAKLKQQVGELKQCAEEQEARELTAENTLLAQEVERLRRKLVALEIRNGVKQVQLPASAVHLTSKPTTTAPASKPPAKQAQPDAPAEGQPKKEGKKEKKKGDKKQQQPAAEVIVDVTALDFRIGRIIDVKKHPDADTLYVEEIDCGEEAPRTICSGLVNNVTIEEMQNRIVIICCNLKPVKMRGIFSQGMVMCACSPDKTEILDAPAGAVPGDRISFQGYPMPETFPPQMNPKKKIFEKVQPDLNLDDKGVATYKGVPWEIQGKGICKAATMTKSIIK